MPAAPTPSRASRCWRCGGDGGADDTTGGTTGGDDPKPEACDTSVVGNICTIAGSGANGYDADADTEVLPALEAKLNLPQDVLTAPDGTLFVIDWNNHRIRRVKPE